MLLTDGANNAGTRAAGRRPAGGRSWRARLHDRVRDGGRRGARRGVPPAVHRPRAGGCGGLRVRWRRLRRWRRRRVPARHRRGHAQAGRQPHRRRVLPGRERRASSSRSSRDLPTTTITKSEPVEVSAGFVGLGALLAAMALLLGRAWRPLPRLFARASRAPRAPCHCGARKGADRVEAATVARTIDEKPRDLVVFGASRWHEDAPFIAVPLGVAPSEPRLPRPSHRCQ